MVPLWSTLLLTNFSVRRISFCHTNINIFRLAQKSSSELFSSVKHKLGIYIFGGKAVERAGALVPTTGTGNEKRRTLKKSTVPSSRFVDNVPLWKGYAKKREQMSDKICEAWPIFSLKRKTHFFYQSSSQVIKLKHFWEARVYKIFFNPRHLYWNVTMPSILETTAETPSTCYARW